MGFPQHGNVCADEAQHSHIGALLAATYGCGLHKTRTQGTAKSLRAEYDFRARLTWVLLLWAQTFGNARLKTVLKGTVLSA